MNITYQQLKTDYMNALKAKDKPRQSVLSVLIGKIDNDGELKQHPENETQIVMDAIQSTIKSIQKAKSDFADKANSEYLEKLAFEYMVLSAYLPKQITGDELKSVIQQLIANVPDGANVTGYVMKELKAQYNGCYDGKEANVIINSLK